MPEVDDALRLASITSRHSPSIPLVVFILAMVGYALYQLRFGDLDLHLASPSLIGLPGEDAVSLSTLLFIRCVFLAITWATVIGAAVDKEGNMVSTIYNVGSRIKGPIVIVLNCTTRFSTFTMQCWCLWTVYMTGATACSLLLYFGFTLESVPHVVFAALWLAYEVSFVCAFLVTSVVTFVLIPGKLATGDDANFFFHWRPLVMHNINVLIAATELLLNRMTLRWSHFPIALLWGGYYVIFSWFWLRRVGVVYYPFLDPTLPARRSVPTVAILMSVLVTLFGLGVAIESITHWNFSLRALVVFAGCASISWWTPFFFESRAPKRTIMKTQ